MGRGAGRMIGTCHICGVNGYVERHHIFGGTANRKLSEADGLVVYLCPNCHRHAQHAAHRCKATMDSLHKAGQAQWMQETGGSVDDFRKRYGKNYLD